MATIDKPTPKQIAVYVKYLRSLEVFYGIHLGNQKTVPDLAVVHNWLEAEAAVYSGITCGWCKGFGDVGMIKCIHCKGTGRIDG